MMFDGSSLQETWNPSVDFLRSKQAEFYCPYTGKNEKVVWKFHEIRNNQFPVVIARCEIETLGMKGIGFADGFLLKGALIRALGEAWERFWLFALPELGVSEFDFLDNSNGYGAGPDGATALAVSRRELVERALFIQAWQDQKGWNPVRPRSWKPKLNIQIMKHLGWEPKVFELKSSSLGSTLAGFATHPEKGTVFDCCHQFHDLRLGIPDAKLTRSLLRLIFVEQREGKNALDQLPEECDVIDHYRFYLNSKHQGAFDFLEDSSSSHGDLILENETKIQSKLILPANPLPAVAVSYHPEWQKMKWGPNSIGGKNPWPHPLG